MNELAGISQGLFSFFIIIFSIIIHEVAHGYAAYVQGDHTAARAGRLTLNPIPHIDMMGSVIIPCIAFFTAGTFFGWAKPVPYNPHNIRTKIGQAFVASAGILANLGIAVAMGVIFKVLLVEGSLTEGLGAALFTIISINISLAFFNLIPIPPFDGMAIIQSLFPRTNINSQLVYNPVYMIVAIIGASVLYGMFSPFLFDGIKSLLL